jgi:chorismate mutase
MLMIHKNMAYVVEDTEKEISKTFSKILSIVVENNMMLPEEFFEVEAAVKQITEEGESAAPTNVVAGIEPTVPRIKRKPTNDPIVTDSN